MKGPSMACLFASRGVTVNELFDFSTDASTEGLQSVAAATSGCRILILFFSLLGSLGMMGDGRFIVNLVLTASLMLASGGPPAAGQEGNAGGESWLIGAGRRVITPVKPLMMAGYASRTKPATDKDTDLWAKVLYLEDGESNRGVMICLDLVGIGRDVSQRVCKRLNHSFGLKRQQIALFTSHTHSGPVVGMNLAPMHYLLADELQQKRIDAYADRLVDDIETAVGMAIDACQPGRVQWGSGKATFAVNRRENKPYDIVPEKRAKGTLSGPVDHDVPVLAARDLSGKLVAVVFGYACHATTLAAGQWNADYPGYAQLELEKMYPGCTAMFWAGCGADQNPLPRRTVELAKNYGNQLARAVGEVLAGPMAFLESDLRTQYEETDLKLQEIPGDLELNQAAQSSNRYEASRARLLKTRTLADGSLADTYPYPIAIWELGGEVDFVHLGGEVVVDYAIRLKDELNGHQTWVAAYANDVMAYIPSRRVLAEGGYEGGGSNVYYGLPGIWHPDSEARIVDAVRKQVEKTKSGSLRE